MQKAHKQFSDNIAYISELDTLYHYLKDNLRLPNDLSDLLRSEIVYVMSALDKLVHELIRIGMIEAFNGTRPKTNKFDGFGISTKTLDRIKETTIERTLYPTRLPTSDSELPEYWFEQEVVLKHKFISFQAPDKIADGLSYIWVENNKWKEISTRMGMKEKDAKIQLEMIANRRNLIVHEADINVQTGLKNIIDENDTKESVEFIVKLGEAIFECVK